MTEGGKLPQDILLFHPHSEIEVQIIIQLVPTWPQTASLGAILSGIQETAELFRVQCLVGPLLYKANSVSDNLITANCPSPSVTFFSVLSRKTQD